MLLHLHTIILHLERYFQDLEKHPISVLPHPQDLNIIWPPLLVFKNDTIYSDVYFETVKSPFKINSSNEFITLDLRNENGFQDILWKIKTLNDSILIVNRYYDGEMGTNSKENVRFVKME